LLLSLAQETWLIEFISAMVFSQGGRFTDDKGMAVMADADKGALKALTWIVDAVHKHKIVSPACVETGELAGLKAFGSGQFAFGLIPKYRVRTLNDPAQSQIPGKVKLMLMPRGDKGSHATVGWMRFYGLTSQARKDKERTAEAVQLMEWFGWQGRRRLSLPEDAVPRRRRGVRGQVAVSRIPTCARPTRHSATST